MGLIRDVIHAGGTGGLSWHAQAYHARKRWQPTVQLIAQFLAQVQPKSEHLVLIGGSAGWMMPPDWLSRFKRIDAYDIDPLAPWLFDWRHGRTLKMQGTEVQHHRQDALATLPDILKAHPQACLWFDNVLGQHRFRVRDAARVERELAQLKTTLTGRHWGSVHDLYSGPTQGQAQPEAVMPRFKVIGSPGADISQALLSSVGAKGEWRDHLTQDVFPTGTATHLIPWAFRPDDWHWLQAGWVTGGPTG